MPATHPNNDVWLAKQLADIKSQLNALRQSPVYPGATVARAYLAGAFTLTPSTWNTIPLDTKSFDPANCFNLSTHRYNVPMYGHYLGLANVLLEVSATGTYTEYAAAVWKNGAQEGSALSEPAVATYAGSLAGDILECEAGDYLTLNVFSTQGVVVYPSAAYTYLAVVRVA